MPHAQKGTLRYRQINALSWRVASELARRDNSLYVGFAGDEGSAAHSDVLALGKSGELTYEARRCGLGFRARKFELPWDEALSMENPREIATVLENALGLHLPMQSPPTSARALGYRVMAAILEMTVGESRYWWASEAPGEPFERDSQWTNARAFQWEATRWSLYRGSEQVAELDNFGTLNTDDRTIDLLSRYRELDGRLNALVVELFGKHLP